jgi:endonuclease G
MIRLRYVSIVTVSLLLFISSCRKEQPIKAPGGLAWHDQQDSPVSGDDARSSAENLVMGNPSSAVADPYYYWNYLVTKTQFSMSYHRDRGTPNWVSWHLDDTWLGSTPRQDNFRADATLPTGWYRVTNTDYTSSGFDRGHNCPSADRTYSVEDNGATFLMTNMIPQAPVNNQQTWANLENYCRKLVTQGYECYVIMGSYGSGGTGSAGTKTTIAGGKVTVPNRIWKVILVLPKGSDDVNRVSTATRVIAVNTPNINTTSSSWGTYRTTVDAIEQATGYNLLSTISSTIQTTIESRVDSGPTQ